MNAVPVPVTIRPTAALRVYVALFTVVWCGGLLYNVLLGGWAVAPVAAGMLALGGTVLARQLCLVVVADEDGLFVRNYFRTRRFAWNEIADFRVGRPAGFLYLWYQLVNVVPRTDREMRLDVTMMTFWPVGRRHREKLEESAAALRAWLPR